MALAGKIGATVTDKITDRRNGKREKSSPRTKRITAGAGLIALTGIPESAE